MDIYIDVRKGNYTVAFYATLTVDVGKGQQIEFDVAGTYVEKIMKLDGTLRSSGDSVWHPFDLDWLSIQYANVSMIVDATGTSPSLKLLKFALLGEINTGSISIKENIEFEYDYTNSTTNGWILTCLTDASWKDLIGVVANPGQFPGLLDSIKSVDSRSLIIVSNVDTAKALHGVTLVINTTVSQGAIMESIGLSETNSSSVGNPLIMDNTGTSTVFQCRFYLPVFNSNYNTTLVFSFMLRQVGTFRLSKFLESTGFDITVDLYRRFGGLDPDIRVDFGLRLYPELNDKPVDVTGNGHK
jgi:hypothetical protein